MSFDDVIRVEGLAKRYEIYDRPQDRLKQFLWRGKRQYFREFWALRDVDFSVRRGQALGIIGKNGCGKSTLLQIIAGTLAPTLGNIQVDGRVAALLELGSGFNPEFSGRENIYLTAAILGLERARIDGLMSEIAGFADIGEFLDQPLKHYSSGMQVRLAFSVFVCLEPDVLIVDEALSVGDVFFQQKCFARIRQIIDRGTTCLFVSHDTNAVLNLCDEALLLNEGRVEFRGPPEEAVSRYFSLGGRRAQRKSVTENQGVRVDERGSAADPEEILATNILKESGHRHGAGGIEIVAARVTDQDGNDTLEVSMSESLTFHLLMRANVSVDDASAGIHLFDRLGNLVFAAGTRQLGQRLPHLEPGQQLIVRLYVRFSVQPGEYTFSLGTSEPSADGPNAGYVHDRHEMLGPIAVTSDPAKAYPFFGIAQLPMRIELRAVAQRSFAAGEAHLSEVSPDIPPTNAAARS